jgi:hypothetical protein
LLILIVNKKTRCTIHPVTNPNPVYSHTASNVTTGVRNEHCPSSTYYIRDLNIKERATVHFFCHLTPRYRLQKSCKYQPDRFKQCIPYKDVHRRGVVMPYMASREPQGRQDARGQEREKYCILCVYFSFSLSLSCLRPLQH